jgi:nucleoside-diphosphate-sugar epimerase
MNFLITGTNGFIGSEFLHFLSRKVKKKDNIFAIVRSNKYKKIFKKKKDINFIKCDLKKNLSKLKLIKFDVVFHFAAQANHHLPKEQNHLTKSDNFIATKNLIKNINKDCVFVFSSTDKVYNPYSKCKENSKLKPQTYLASQKVRCEKMIKDRFSKYFIFRLPIVHANGKFRKHSIVDQFLFDLIKNKKINIFSNIKRSFIKTSEFNQILVSLHINKKYGIYNVGTKLKSYYNRVYNLSKNKYKKKLMNKLSGMIEPKIQKFDTSKYKKSFKVNLT